MKKRALALILCLVLVATLLVSCGETDYDKSKDYINSHPGPQDPDDVTLNLYIPAAGAVDAGTVDAMQKEFNSTYGKLDAHTRVVFHLVDVTDEETYRTLMTEKAKIAFDRKEAGEKDDTTPGPGEKFPKEGENQFDIFVSLDLDMLKAMQEAGYLVDLTSQLTGAYASRLKNEMSAYSIAPVIYKNATLDGKYYGVPSNFLIGNYTYDVFDKEFFDAHYGEGVPDADHVIADITTESLNKLKSTAGDKHMTIPAPNEQRVTYATRYEIENRIADKGWSDYVVAVTATPTLSQQEIFRGMFCISASCAYPDRALEVITAIYTNSSLHTTLQYGAQNVTYKLVDTEGGQVVVPIDNAPSYLIDTRYTGNVLTIIPTAESVLGTRTGFTPYAIGIDFVVNANKQNKEAKYN